MTPLRIVVTLDLAVVRADDATGALPAQVEAAFSVHPAPAERRAVTEQLVTWLQWHLAQSGIIVVMQPRGVLGLEAVAGV